MQPHLRTRHLIQLLQANRSSSPKLRIPDWLSDSLEKVCEFIEPIQGEARVGYDCRFVDPAWELDLFLGKNERIGGSLDGLADYVSYTANVAGILGLFSSVRRCEWLALTTSEEVAIQTPDSGIAIEGDIAGHPIRLVLRMTPPAAVGTGLKVYPDGRHILG